MNLTHDVKQKNLSQGNDYCLAPFIQNTGKNEAVVWQNALRWDALKCGHPVKKGREAAGSRTAQVSGRRTRQRRRRKKRLRYSHILLRSLRRGCVGVRFVIIHKADVCSRRSSTE